MLAGYSQGSIGLPAVVAALAQERLLVPVLAQADTAATGPREASAGIVAVAVSDGRQALPVFTSVDAMRAWRSDARPVPVAAPRAALSAVSEGWSLLIVDPAGPVTVVMPRPAVWALAQGLQWRPAVVDGIVDPEVSAALVEAVGGVEQVISVQPGPGRQAEIAVRLLLSDGLDRAGLDRVLAEVNAALASSSVTSERVDSLELRIGSTRSPGERRAGPAGR